MTDRTPARTAARIAPLLFLLPLAACGRDVSESGAGPEMTVGPNEVDEFVNDDLSLQDVEIEYPADGRYEPGEDADLYFALTNNGSEPITLVDVSGPDFEGVELTGGDGGGLPLVIPEDDNTYVGAADEPSLSLLGLTTDLRSSQSIPITFTFEQAGEVTLEVPVASTPRDSENPDTDFGPPVDEDPSEDSGVEPEPTEEPGG